MPKTHIQTMPVEPFGYSVAILSCVLDIIKRRYGKHAGNYSRNRGHMVAEAWGYLPFISNTSQQAVLCWAIPVSGSCKFHAFMLSLNRCDLFWWVIRGVIVGFCSGRGVKIVNAYKKNYCEGPAEGQFPYGSFLMATWCLLRAPQSWLPTTGCMSCLQVLKGPLGFGVQMMLFWIPLCDLETLGAAAPRCWCSPAMRTKGKKPSESQAEMWQGLRSRADHCWGALSSSWNRSWGWQQNITSCHEIHHSWTVAHMSCQHRPDYSCHPAAGEHL